MFAIDLILVVAVVVSAIAQPSIGRGDGLIFPLVCLFAGWGIAATLEYMGLTYTAGTVFILVIVNLLVVMWGNYKEATE